MAKTVVFAVTKAGSMINNTIPLKVATVIFVFVSVEFVVIT